MKFRAYQTEETSAIQDLFVSAFTESEGETEGTLIGGLTADLIHTTDKQDLYGFVAVDRGQIVGGVFFSRLTFAEEIDVFLLAPAAVHPDYQGKGIGQNLINHGLRQLERDGVEIVTTYGDAGFYRRVGFSPLPQNVIAPPRELSQPEGWLGQSLTGDSIDPIAGPSSCVNALENPVYW